MSRPVPGCGIKLLPVKCLDCFLTAKLQELIYESFWILFHRSIFLIHSKLLAQYKVDFAQILQTRKQMKRNACLLKVDRTRFLDVTERPSLGRFKGGELGQCQCCFFCSSSQKSILILTKLHYSSRNDSCNRWCLWSCPACTDNQAITLLACFFCHRWSFIMV